MHWPWCMSFAPFVGFVVVRTVKCGVETPICRWWMANRAFVAANRSQLTPNAPFIKSIGHFALCWRSCTFNHDVSLIDKTWGATQHEESSTRVFTFKACTLRKIWIWSELEKHIHTLAGGSCCFQLGQSNKWNINNKWWKHKETQPFVQKIWLIGQRFCNS